MLSRYPGTAHTVQGMASAELIISEHDPYELTRAIAVISAQGWTITNGYNMARAVESLDVLASVFAEEAGVDRRETARYARGRHDELSAMTTGARLCWLTGNTYAVGRISDEIEELGFASEQVATTFGVMAGKMLVEAAGTRANAIIVADRVSRQVSARQARRVLGMDRAA